MLTLPIKKKWFDMILSGEKKEEYREIKPYYESRFMFAGFLSYWCDDHMPTGSHYPIRLRNGYRLDSPMIEAIVSLTIGEGKPEWGAEPNKTYYVLHIEKILSYFDGEKLMNPFEKDGEQE